MTTVTQRPEVLRQPGGGAVRGPGRQRSSRRTPLAPHSIDLIDRAHESLVGAIRSPTAGERYVAAHLAALRAAAAVLAVRGRTDHRRRLRSVWEVLPTVAPELGEWAAFFEAGASRRAALEAGRSDAVSLREADDLVRDAEAFLILAESAVGFVREQ